MNETQELLSQLRDIQTPSVSAIPAIGWWILLVVCVLLLWLFYVLYRRYQRRAWQREAQAELAYLRLQLDTVPVAHTLSATSKLIRRVVLAVRPRQAVAGLQGEAWLAELDDICGNSQFTDGFGKLLEDGPYQPSPSIGKDDLNALMDVVADLIKSAGRTPGSRGSE